MANEIWSIPPVLTTDPAGRQYTPITLQQGVVTAVKINGEWLFQNVSDNEDDYVEFSLHGDPEGVWGKLNTHSFVRVQVPIFFLNRSHKKNVIIAAFEQGN